MAGGAGVSYIQFDAPYYSHYLDAHQRERMRAEGVDPDAELEQAIAGDNAALAGVPRADTTFALHVCRGNSRSRWYTEGAYDAIAERLFGTLDVDTFLLEYDDERSGGFEPLRLVPNGKNVVLGLVTTSSRRSNPSTRCAAAHRRSRRATCRSSTSPSARSAALRRSRAATC